MRDAETTADKREENLVHELGHCAQGIVIGRTVDNAALPSWLLEGLPNWMVGKLLGRFSDSGWWTAYLTRQTPDLRNQSYDAMGFWWQLDKSGLDVWSLVVPMLEKVAEKAIPGKPVRDDEAVFDVAVNAAYKTPVLQAWASGFERDAFRNAAWDITGAGITKDRYAAPNHGTVRNGGAVHLEALAFQPQLVKVDLKADVVRLSTAATAGVFGRFGPGPGGDYPLPEALSTVFCTLGTACVCPPDTPKADARFTTIQPGKARLAATGGAVNSSVDVTGQSLKEYCGEPKDKNGPPPISGTSPNGAPGPGGPTAPPQGCKDCKTASTHGDPHIVTFDAAFYDLQSAGEFTLAASLDDALVVQSRQEPLGSSKSFGVNTAAAANVAGDRVGFYLRPQAPWIEVHVNGKTVTPAAGNTALPEGGTLTRFGESASPGYSVAWPDGSTLYVTRTSAEALKIDMAVPATRKGRLNGLLGDNDGSPANDLDAGEGRILPNSDPPYADLHGVFADHWRVKQAKSLFDYAPGESTATFTDRSFPSTRVDPATLPGRADAEAQCKAAGVTGKPQLDACVLDVAVTGKREFAESAAAQQKFTESTHGATPGTGTGLPVDPVCLRESKPGPKTLTMNVGIGETVRAGGTGRLLCGGYLPAGEWQHNLLFSSPTGQQVQVTRSGDAECRLQWTVYKAYVSSSPAVPKVSVCQSLAPLTLEPGTVYILVVDKPAPDISGLYGLTLT
jgi:hypothetical protein